MKHFLKESLEDSLKKCLGESLKEFQEFQKEFPKKHVQWFLKVSARVSEGNPRKITWKSRKELLKYLLKIFPNIAEEICEE